MSFLSSLLLNVAVFILFVVSILYLWMKYQYGYWRRRNVYSPPASFPMGHLGASGVKTHPGIHYMNIYNETAPHPYVGIFFITRKTLIVRDLEMVRNVLSRDYNYFLGHGFKTNREADPLWYNLFNMDGDEWKTIHNKITPAFTPSKMKWIFDTILESSHEMVSYIDSQIERDNVIDFKDVVARLGTDVIASTTFGVQTNSFKEPDAEFRVMGKLTFEPEFWKGIVDILSIIAPNFVDKMKLGRNRAEVTHFFQKIVKDLIKSREENSARRNDLMQLFIDMMHEEKDSENYLSIEEITAQVFIFFLGGFETSSIAAVHSLLEIAKNPEIKEKLMSQIENVWNKYEEKITYDLLNNMTYLNNVVEEALRMYPPFPFLFRSCTTDYRIPDTNTTIEKGTLVVVPILGIQRDPEIYPDPDVFDPERFSQENCRNRHSHAYLPFGEGPRICIGYRFGMIQVKLAVLMILKNFDVEITEKTQLTPVYDPRSFLLQPEGELLLRVTRRPKPRF